jgi:TatD DNase family protein
MQARIIDTHCHLFSAPLSDDTDAVIERALLRGVGTMVVPAVDLPSSEEAVRLAARYPGVVFAAVGVHPQMGGGAEVDTGRIAALAGELGVVAIGEIGLDAHEGPELGVQVERFMIQMDLAAELKLPVLVHCRGAFSRLVEIVSGTGPGLPGGILHAWAGSLEILKTLEPLGFYAGVAGVASRPQATRVRGVVGAIPLERMVLETDAPYIGTNLKPKGTVEPADAAEVCAAVALLKGVPYGEVARVTSVNAARILRLP